MRIKYLSDLMTLILFIMKYVLTISIILFLLDTCISQIELQEQNQILYTKKDGLTFGS
jgi:hypothetical protein